MSFVIIFNFKLLLHFKRKPEIQSVSGRSVSTSINSLPTLLFSHLFTYTFSLAYSGKHSHMQHLLDMQEFCVKKAGRIEVIAMFALFAMLVSIVEMYLFFDTFFSCRLLCTLGNILSINMCFHNNPLGPYLKGRISKSYLGLQKL